MAGEANAAASGAGQGDVVAQAHAKLVADTSLQFSNTTAVAPEVPDWLRWVGEFFLTIAPVLRVLFWIGLALVAAFLLYVIVREVLNIRKGPKRPKSPEVAPEPEWQPDASDARDLLTAADALAAKGQYAEAAHLILLRSIEDLAKRRPRALRPGLTTRDIADLPTMPAAARPAFTLIGRLVERSLFGGRPVGADDFGQCRKAYEDFAFPDGWAR